MAEDLSNLLEEFELSELDPHEVAFMRQLLNVLDPS